MPNDGSHSERITVPVIYGPTASGKTALSALIAEADPTIEIISADSCQIYRRLDIGAAKADRSFRDRIPHHLIDILDPTERYSAGMFARDAAAAIRSIIERGRRPVIVGGTGFYLRALFEGLAAPPLDPKIADTLARRLEVEGLDALRAELLSLDPEVERTIDLSNREKIVRALGSIVQYGVSYSSHVDRERMECVMRPIYLLIDPERAALYAEIDRRVITMVEDGLIEEVAALRREGVPDDAKGFRSVGYPDVIRMLDGEITMEEMIASIQRNTRRFAKRQVTWMRTQIAAKGRSRIVSDFREGVEWYRRSLEDAPTNEKP